MKYKIVQTQEGSATLYSYQYQEHYHSLSGAWQEALERYVLPCGILPHLQHFEEISILDVGFGLGFNAVCALNTIQNANFTQQKKVYLLSLENDQELLSYLPNLPIPPKFSKIYTYALQFSYWDFQKKKHTIAFHLGPKVEVKWQMYLGNAQNTLSLCNQKFDAVFLDPFSPAKNPELWSLDFLRSLYAKTHPKRGILSTYSSAIHVRVRLMASGFSICPGPRVGTKSSGTLATIERPLPSQFSPKYLRKLNRRLQRYLQNISMKTPPPKS
ncbi:MAG: hypothetical protein D6805_07125 [Planctomycetota bacterium]|nr:MAG: hypothetical protein D6805_07125 [Planctomycetota bacterium]